MNTDSDQEAGNSHLAAGEHFWYGGIGGMGRKRIIWLTVAFFAALLVVAVCIVVEPGGPPEPMYQGKPLSFYLRDKPLTPGGIRNGLAVWARPTTRTAVMQIGKDAIPTLLRWLKAKHSPIKAKFASLSQDMPWAHYDYWDAFERNKAGCDGFHILGSSAAAAVPQIMQIFRTQISEESQEAAAISLGYIGGQATPALPMLEAGARGSSERVRAACVWALGEIRTSPQESVQYLIVALADPDIYVRISAAGSLFKYADSNAAAKPAVPALVKALSDTNESVNAAAEHALKAIDPAALEQARKEGKVRPR